MATQEKKCVSCGVNVLSIKGSVSFKCPKCSEADVNRCLKCRSNGKEYTCPSCGFIGP